MADGTDPADVMLMARTMWGENNNASPDEYAAIASVMRNRMLSGNSDFGGNTVSRIALAPNQFQAWNDPNKANFPMKAPVNSPAFQSAYKIASDVMTGQQQDPTGGAVYYYNPKEVSKTPAFAQGRQGTQIGSHRFYGPMDDDKSYLSQFENPAVPSSEKGAAPNDDKDYLSQFEQQKIPSEQAPVQPQASTSTSRVANAFEELPATATERPLDRRVNMEIGKSMADFVSQHPYLAGAGAAGLTALIAPALPELAVTAGIPLAAKGLYHLGKTAASKTLDYEILSHLLRP